MVQTLLRPAFQDQLYGEIKGTLEIVVQGIILCTAMCSVGLVTRWWILGLSRPGDFIICYNAALGDFRPLAEGNVWLWKREIAHVFIPLTWTDIVRAYWYYSAIQTLCFMLLAHKMMEVPFGFLPVLLVLPSFASLLQVGNIQITLCLAAIYPVTVLLAGLVKPHHLLFALLLAVVGRYRAVHEDRQRLHTAG
jgi:hypothetical protein